MGKQRKNCLCTAMMYDPKDHYEPEETVSHFNEKAKVFERLLNFKQARFLRNIKKTHLVVFLTSLFTHYNA
jgi:hypothetical protein